MKMNVPRYTFSKESEPELLKFFKVAQEHKSSNCDLEKHRIWQKLLPPDPSLLQKLDEIDTPEQITVIDISSDEEPIIPQSFDQNSEENAREMLEKHNQTSISDIAFAIKENLETQHELSEIARENLTKCLVNELEELFEVLSESLTSEEIFYFGVSLQNCVLNAVVNNYCRCLLVPRLKTEYNDNLLNLLDQYSTKYALVLKEELLSNLQGSGDEIKILLQYINNLNPDYQAVLLRDFIFSIDKLDNNKLSVVENLMNGQVEYEALNKLVEMLSNIAEEYSKDKAFGKLLVNTIQYLGPNIIHLEQPLKHIIAGHRSVWRSKLEKTFSTCYEDTSMLSQSFRD